LIEINRCAVYQPPMSPKGTPQRGGGPDPASIATIAMVAIDVSAVAPLGAAAP
jgi:hypothetical protein